MVNVNVFDMLPSNLNLTPHVISFIDEFLPVWCCGALPSLNIVTHISAAAEHALWPQLFWGMFGGSVPVTWM